jgi:hypothetical protein
VSEQVTEIEIHGFRELPPGEKRTVAFIYVNMSKGEIEAARKFWEETSGIPPLIERQAVRP